MRTANQTESKKGNCTLEIQLDQELSAKASDLKTERNLSMALRKGEKELKRVRGHHTVPKDIGSLLQSHHCHQIY